MGREIRKVPPNWIHPVNERGQKQPLRDEDFDSAVDDWIEDRRKWNAYEDPARSRYETEVGHLVAYSEWNGGPPDPEYYRPAWPDESRTAFQVYETVSEGTPVSPVFPTREALILWLTNDGDGMGIGGCVQRLSQEAAERFAEAAWAPTMIASPGRGVESGLAIHDAPASLPAQPTAANPTAEPERKP